MSMPKRIYDIYRQILRLPLIADKVATPETFAEFQTLLIEAQPIDETEKAQRSLVWGMYHSNPTNFMNYVTDRSSRVGPIILWTESKRISQAFRLAGVAHISWSAEDGYSVGAHNGTRTNTRTNTRNVVPRRGVKTKRNMRGGKSYRIRPATPATPATTTIPAATPATPATTPATTPAATPATQAATPATPATIPEAIQSMSATPTPATTPVATPVTTVVVVEPIDISAGVITVNLAE